MANMGCIQVTELEKNTILQTITYVNKHNTDQKLGFFIPIELHILYYD